MTHKSSNSGSDRGFLLPRLLLLLLLATFVSADTGTRSAVAASTRQTSSLAQKTCLIHSNQQEKLILPNASLKAVNRGGAEGRRVHFADEREQALRQQRRSELMNDLIHRLRIGFYFGLWYALNVYYNIVNKKLLNILPAPLIVGTIQLAIGGLYVSLLWLLQIRARPTGLSAPLVSALRKVGLWHSLGQLLTMASLCAGPVSFTHIVKALEPFFSAIVSALAVGTWMPLPVYLTLIPVVAGVGYASFKERSFSWLAFNTAMGSNLAFALRAVLSKVAMTTAATYGADVRNLSAPNVFGLVTCASFWISLPIALAGEGRGFSTLYKTAVASFLAKDTVTTSTPLPTPRHAQIQLVQTILLSGLFHYLNNEVMYLALGSVHPVTLAVGNTMKRVFIILASVLVFRNEITQQSVIGSAVGLAGVLLYSITKQRYETLDRQERERVIVAGGKPRRV